MAKQFKGFSNQQTHQLLSEMGYTGPAQKDDMDLFLASSPSAASKIGRYADIAKQRVEGGPLSGVGMQQGGQVLPDNVQLFDTPNAASGTEIKNSGFADQDISRLAELEAEAALMRRPDSNSSFDMLRPGYQPVSRIVEQPNLSQPGVSGSALGLGVDIGGKLESLYLPDKENPKSEDQIKKEYAAAQEEARKARAGGMMSMIMLPGEMSYEDFAEQNRYNVIKNPNVPEHMFPEGAALPQDTGTLKPSGITPSYNYTYDQAVARQAQRDVKSPEEARAIKIALDMGPDAIPAPEGSEVLSVGTPSPETTQASTDLDAAQTAYSDAMGTLTDAQKALSGAEQPVENVDNFDAFKYYKESDDVTKGILNNLLGNKGVILDTDGNASDPDQIQALYNAFTQRKAADDPFIFTDEKQQEFDAYEQLTKDVEDAELLTTQTQADVSTAQKQFETTEIPSTSEALGKAITNPSSVLSQPTVYGLKVEDNQLIDEGTGQVVTAATLLVKQAQAADAVDDPAVKSTMAYLNKFTDDELREKYPLPEIRFELLQMDEASLSRGDLSLRRGFFDKLQQRQAQIEQDAVADRAETYDAVTSQPKVKTALEDFAAAKGVPSDKALMEAETMDPDELAQLDLDAETLDVIRQIPEMKRQLDVGELPDAAIFDEYTKAEDVQFKGEVEEIDPAKFETETPKAESEVDYNLPPTKVAEQEEAKVKDAAQFDEIATAEEKKSEFVADVTAEETAVGADEVVDVNKILNSEEVIVAAKTLDALNDAATAKAATATFTQQLAAKAVKGEVSAASTVQGQMSKLMEQFNDGTPAWAAGALRNVTAAMNARGMGASSMSSAAMIQAAMESAIPIAQSDAATFQAMDMENVRNEQAVALANAAAAQNFELANLSNEQAVRIQNSMNNANLQLKNLSNEQEAVLATAQFKASLQGQELSISANVAISNAARYAAVNDINLTNRQQTSILRSTQNLEVEMANLSNEQQTALSNLQVKAAMMGQDLTNEQQMAVLESTQAFEANMGDATRKQQAFIQDAVATAAMEGRVLDNKQQTALFNVSNEVAERGIELNNEQQTAIFNMSNKMTMDVENLSNRQATALANAQIEAAMKGQELSNKQQTNIIRAERIAEVANMNFTAEQSRALQNAQLAQTVDLANLSNEQAKLMADVASMAQLDMANLNNRQQAAAQQASAFLEMDMANLDNEQQAVMFEAQSLVQSIFSDQAAENAQMQFNAESINQVNQFFEGMSTQVQQFNTAQENAMEQFNTGEENTMTKFQAELDNQRDMFNAQNELVVAQATTVWRQTVATANTAALNEANMQEVMAANSLTVQGLNELWQQERDLMNFAWTSAEKQTDRDHALVLNKINNDSAEDAAYSSATGTFLGAVVGGVFDNWSSIF